MKSGIKVRWINVDGEGLRKDKFIEIAKKYPNVEKLVESLEFVYASKSNQTPPILCNSKNMFMATIYFTSQIAHFTIKAYNFQQKNFYTLFKILSQSFPS